MTLGHEYHSKDNTPSLYVAPTSDNGSALQLTGISLVDANALCVSIVDGNGDQITSFGGGTQYTDAAVAAAHPIGTGIIFNNGGTYNFVSAAQPLPVTGTFFLSTQPISIASAQVASGAFASGSISDGAMVTIGNKTDAKSTATDTTSVSIMSVLKEISAMAQAPASTPVTGTVTANAGTNLNTSLLALESGGNLATLAAAIIAQEATTSGVKGMTMFGAVTTGKPTYTTGKSDALSLDVNGLLRISLADTPVNGTAFAVSLAAETTKVIGVVRNADGAGNLFTTNSSTFTAKFAQDTNFLGTLGTAFSTPGKVDTKAADGDVFVRSNAASTFPTQATLQTQTDTVMIGGVNIKEINAVTPLMGNGTTGTGSLRITPASDSTGIANYGHGATAASVPSGATYKGVRGTTALPTAVTDGQMVGAMGDKFGRQVVIPNGMRDIVLPMTQLTLTATTTETSLIAAVASTFNDLLSVIVINSSATATQVDFRDSTGGAIRLTLYIPAGDTRGVVFQTPLPQSAVNTAWTAKCGTSVSSVIITGNYVTNK